MIKDTSRWTEHVIAACFHFDDCRRLKELKKQQLHYQDRE